MKKMDLTVLGSINVDHVISVPYFVKPGETLQGHSYKIAYGGKGANQAVACARLKNDNINVNFLGCLGSDSIGKEIRASLEHDGINVSAIETVENNLTGIAFIQVDEKGENSIVISSGANANLDDDYVEKYKQQIIQSHYLLMQLETPISAIEKAAILAKKNDVKVVLNPAPAQVLSDNLLQHIDIITPNETEAEILSGIQVTDESSAQQAANFFHSKGIKLVLITLGSKGVFFSENGQGEIIPSYSVNAVDTTAAGDTFNGGFLCALLEGKTIKQSILFANASGALSVTKHGAQPSIPSRNEVIQFQHEH